ncbi:hypothetical protein DNTS_034399 [Danionella cerebrum]|uniref:Protein lin-52 homolog n=1 Tax=Danionella cerebrum TaxID=2873325 RepID=A0A553MQB5_9TELE|nr:hypothetical protein DNTS_034399 [Danionella translucida]
MEVKTLNHLCSVLKILTGLHLTCGRSNNCIYFQPITNSPPKWMAELESEDVEMLKELGSLTTANLMEKVKGLQNLAYQLGLEESREMTRGKFLNILERPKK